MTKFHNECSHVFFLFLVVVTQVLTADCPLCMKSLEVNINILTKFYCNWIENVVFRVFAKIFFQFSVLVTKCLTSYKRILEVININNQGLIENLASKESKRFFLLILFLVTQTSSRKIFWPIFIMIEQKMWTLECFYFQSQ